MNKKDLMLDIEKNIKNCKKCRLCEKATNSVPGEGDINSEIVFIGEAPGEKEDLTGRPFVGRAGNLLEKLLEKIGFKRQDVWIGNIIKHRPPLNRDPLPDEISLCRPFLDLQLETMKPTLIVTLGRYSMSHFYPNGKISRDHGHVVRFKGYNVYPLYHPAAGLRNPSMLKDLAIDFIRIPQVLKEIKSGLTQETQTITKPQPVDDNQLSLGI